MVVKEAADDDEDWELLAVEVFMVVVGVGEHDGFGVGGESRSEVEGLTPGHCLVVGGQVPSVTIAA